MKTVEKFENGILTLCIEGRVDSTNAAELEAFIEQTAGKHEDCAVILDAEKLEYISSAGLRVLLKLRKARPELKIINVSPNVYEIFDMTGFTEMINIEKAYRRISVEGCEKIGEGSNGIVYRLDPETIVKVYRNPDSLPDITRERELARKAFVSGIPTAIPYDVVRVGNSYGSVFEILNAMSLSQLINANPEKLDEYVGIYVDLLKKIHSTEVTPGELPDMKLRVLGWIDDLKGALEPAQIEKLKALVSGVPDVHRMIHGDYHIKNIKVQNGEVLLIDMDTICMGHPVFEFASIFISYIGFPEIEECTGETFLGISVELSRTIWKKTLEGYFGAENTGLIADVEKKSMLLGWLRLLRRTLRRDAENRKSISHCKDRLLTLLAEVPSLAFPPLQKG